MVANVDGIEVQKRMNMKPQELMDRDGFLIYCSLTDRRIGEVVRADGGMTTEPLVIIGQISRDDAREYARRNRVALADRNFYYKAIAE